MSQNHGRARRIAAEWQAPGNAASLLSHKGEIRDDFVAEMKSNIKHAEDRLGVDELNWVILYAQQRGVGTYNGKTGWSRMWDDSAPEGAPV